MKGDGPIRIVGQRARHNTSVTCVGDVLRAMPGEVHGLTTDVLVVVDGSTDCTADVARDVGAMVCELPVNQGQGAALRAGYRLARDRGARFIATLDADGQYDP